MRITKDEVSAEKELLIYPLPHILEICGCVQARIARGHGLGPVHLTFLRRAARSGMVSYDHVHKATELPRYAVSRAATFLKKRGLGKIEPEPDDKRRKWLYITLPGLKLCNEIDRKLAKYFARRFGVSDSIGYCDFARDIWSAARSLDHPILKRGSSRFPAKMVALSEMSDGQRQVLTWIKELQRDRNRPR